MISALTSAWRAAKAVYPYVVVGYELIRAELTRDETPPQPLPWIEVDRIRRAQQVPESHKVKKPNGPDPKHR